MEPARKLATYDDLLALPEGERVEILGGEFVALPAPRPRHSKPQRALGRFIGGPFDDDDGFGGPGGWWIFLEVDVRLEPAEVVRPDLSGFRRERLIEPDQRPIDIAPDWVCEILSPSTAARDRAQKRRLYARHGVKHYWLVDPDARTLEALALHDGRWVEAGSYDEQDTARVPPFEAVELPIGRLFLPKRAAEGEGG
jgi:Uma2 family endonuclease